jgi:replicative DNA helicase
MDSPQNIQNLIGKLGNKYASKRGADATQIIDRVQPQARDMEEAVLGSMMLDKEAVAEVIDILKPESFYVEAHQHIYDVIYDLFAKSQPVDILTVCEQLRRNDKLDLVGGPYYISQLTMRVGSTANVEHYARIVAEKYIMRELIKNSSEIIKDAYDNTNDVFEILDKAEKGLFSITEQNLRRSYDSMSNLVAAAIKQLEHIKNQEGGLIGVPSGFSGLDRLTAGWQKSDLIILAARPAMGKTAFVLNLARNSAINYKRPVAVFSLEMSSLQLVNRLITAETGISAEKLKRADLQPHEWVQLTSKVESLAAAPIFIDDTPGINIFELRAKCRRLKMQHDVQLIIIDYLQLMSGGSSDKKGGGAGNREQEISLISRSLKGIAKELNVPVIALSQLSRAVETRGGDKRPQLSDLRESGSIEQDADMVLFLYRPEYYGLTQDEEGAPTAGITEVIVSKHRNGALATVKVKFVKELTRFVDYDVAGDFGETHLTTVNDVITLSSRMNSIANISLADDDDNVPY